MDSIKSVAVKPGQTVREIFKDILTDSLPMRCFIGSQNTCLLNPLLTIDALFKLITINIDGGYLTRQQILFKESSKKVDIVNVLSSDRVFKIVFVNREKKSYQHAVIRAINSPSTDRCIKIRFSNTTEEQTIDVQYGFFTEHKVDYPGEDAAHPVMAFINGKVVYLLFQSKSLAQTFLAWLWFDCSMYYKTN